MLNVPEQLSCVELFQVNNELIEANMEIFVTPCYAQFPIMHPVIFRSFFGGVEFIKESSDGPMRRSRGRSV